MFFTFTSVMTEKTGRPSKHEFNALEVGEKAILKGRAKIYPHQFINQYNKSGKKLKLIRDGKNIYVERTK